MCWHIIISVPRGCGCIDMLDMLYTSLPVFMGNSQFGQDDVLDDDQLTIAHSRMHGSITLDVHTNSWFAFGST